MAKKLVGFVLSVAAITPLLIGNWPASAQTSSSKMHNSPTQVPMTGSKSEGVTNSSKKHSSLGSSQKPPASGTDKVSRYSPERTPILRIGSRGEPVKHVQAFLKQDKIYNGPIDGVFGRQTHSAVIAFQRSKNLGADGIVGQRTWAKMTKTRLG